MTIRPIALAGAGVGALAGPAPAQTAALAPVAALVRAVDIPYQQFTLPNGLRVIVQTDRKAPIVAVSVWYHVGSKDEPAGRTGFAHLYEHLMFGGSENSDTSWFQPMQAIGATGLNGTTYFDRTNYFETVPRGALDRPLFLESDRMGHLLGALTQAKLDVQRGVVQNEKRQDDNEPGGLVQYAIQDTLFPASHPYHHTTIGSMADLDTASLDVVKDWFRGHYGPNNAVLVLAGDISVDEARPLVAKYFADNARGPVSVPAAADVPTLPAPVVKTFKDQVAQTTVTRIWAVPGVTDADAPALDLAASILGGLASSRMENALVREAKTAVRVSAGNESFERVGEFTLEATVKPGVDPATVGRQVDAILAEFLRTGPTGAELRRAKTESIATTVRGLEEVGGFGGKAVTLASGAVYANDPGFYRKQLAATAALTQEQVRTVARRWLSRPVFAYTLEPGARGAYEEAASTKSVAASAGATTASPAPAPAPTAARSALPAVGAIADLQFPKIEHGRLSNGMEVMFARRTAVPVVQVAVSFDAGNAADPKTKLGTQSLMLSLLDQGTDRLTAEQIAERREELGATISSSASIDRTTITLSALKPNLAASLDLMAATVRRPAFRPEDVERVRGQRLAGIASEMTEPQSLALRTLPPLLYGPRHPYGVPFTGSGDARGVAAVTVADLGAFHDAWLRPDTATVFVVGDTTLAEITPLLEKSFGDWRAVGARPVKNFAVPTPVARSRVVLIDRPGSPQSLIIGGELLPVKGIADTVPLDQANDVLGGSFLSRFNMDLRETKHWAYGSGGQVFKARETLPYLIYAPVQTDQTGPSITALRTDLTEFLTTKGVTSAEMQRTTAGAVLRLPGRFETSDAVLSGLEQLKTYDRPDDYFDTLARRYRSLTAPMLDAAARAALDPAKITWIVIGDAKTVRPQLDGVGLPVEVVPAASAATATN